MCNTLIERATSMLAGGEIFRLIEQEQQREAVKLLETSLKVPPRFRLLLEHGFVLAWRAGNPPLLCHEEGLVYLLRWMCCCQHTARVGAGWRARSRRKCANRAKSARSYGSPQDPHDFLGPQQPTSLDTADVSSNVEKSRSKVTSLSA